MNIRKAVIPVAGLGTRFLPATKTVPKELLPIVDKPTLLYVVEEAVAAGIREIVLIAGRGKSAIEDFFDTSYELEDQLRKNGREDLLKPLKDSLKNVSIISIRQHSALGLGHAVLCAQPAIGNEPFAVLLGDEITLPKAGVTSAIGQLAQLHARTGLSSVAVMEVPDSDVSKYGIIQGKVRESNVWEIQDVVEKPAPDRAPSRLALPGRYVFNSEIFADLKEISPGRGGEIQLTDAMSRLARRQGMLATTLNCVRFDAGDKLGFVKANVELAAEHPEIGVAFQKYLRERWGGK